MKSFIAKGLLGALIISVSGYATTWTLEDLLVQASQNNIDVLDVNEQLADADSKVAEAWGSALPTVSFQAKYNKSLEQYTPTPSENPFANSAPFLNPQESNFSQPTAALAQDLGNLLQGMQGGENTASATLVVTQVLYAQGKIGTGLAIAKNYKSSLESQKAALKQSLKKEVTESYFQVLFLKEALEVYEHSLEQAKKQLENAQKMQNAGLISELDYIQIQLTIEEIETEKTKIGKDLELAKNALLFKIGLPYESSVDFSGSLEVNEPLPKMENALTKALENRSELKQLNQIEELQNEMVNLARADYLPSIVAGGSFTKVSNTNSFKEYDWGNDANVFVQAQWNLFNGFQTKEKVTQARIEKRRVQHQKENLIRALNLQVENSIATFENTQERLEIAKRREKLAQRNFDLSQKSYDAGQLSQLDYKDAELNLRKAKLNLKQNLLLFQIARCELEYAMGEI